MAVRVPPWRYEDEQNADLVLVMVLLDGAYIIMVRMKQVSLDWTGTSGMVGGGKYISKRWMLRPN